MKLKPSASYQRGGYNTNKYPPYTLAGPVMYGLTPGSKHYQDPVTMEGTVWFITLCFEGY
jgi:hypothetical protein